MDERIKALEREVELLQRILELTKQLEELKAKQPVYVPIYPNPWQPYQPSPWWEVKPGTIIYGTTTGATCKYTNTGGWDESVSDNVMVC